MSSEIIIYENQEGNIKIDVRLENETVWLSQKGLGELFNTSKQNVSYRLANIFKEGELDKSLVVKEILTTATDGKNYPTKFYNLDAIKAGKIKTKDPDNVSKKFSLYVPYWA